MTLQEYFDLISYIKKAQKDIRTSVGACKSLQTHMDSIYNDCEKSPNSGVVTVGPCLPDGRYALYATFKNRTVPKKWCGFPVINCLEQ